MSPAVSFWLGAVIGVFLYPISIYLSEAAVSWWKKRKGSQYRPSRYPQAVPGPSAADYAPRPVDPERPPKWMFYAPKREGAMAFCTNCHDALEDGDRVLFFPTEGRTEIICEDCVKKQ